MGHRRARRVLDVPDPGLDMGRDPYLAVSGEVTTLAIPGSASHVGLVLPDRLSFDEWQQVGETLGLAAGAVLWWWGDWLNYGERRYGEKYAQAVDATDYDYDTLKAAAWVCSRIEMVRRRTILTWSHHREVAPMEPSEQDHWLDRAEAERWTVRELRNAIRRRGLGLPTEGMPTSRYRCIVIDPPWPVEKIEREVRPRQGKVLDYAVMSIEQITELPVPDLAEPTGTHLYLWTTHRHLPDAVSLVSSWGFNYQCLLTWIKNVGITPFSWMYSTEHVVFARMGDVELRQLGRRLDFTGKVREHSRKPDEFYDLVREVSPGPMLDMFSREPREGFDQWGNEVGKFEVEALA